MIDPGKRNAIYQLHLEGMSQREISRLMRVSRKAVKRIVDQRGKFVRADRKDKLLIDRELLERLYRECNGWVERIHEKLKEEEKITIGYSTLTRMLRELGIGQAKSTRCHRVPDEPGAEMQHDTTVYQVKLNGVRTRLVASVIYLRYSKRKYLKFYRAFNRFKMKCFLHEALMFWEHSAHVCVIDNTNLARLRGAGSTAIIVPEMAEFARRYGVKFLCHAINHPNRKAGNERSFRTVETNFLPGRTFESLEDLNSQARQWATQRMDQRPQSKTGLIPAKLFEHECLYLNKLPKHLPAPYQTHLRGTDVYGYVTFCANYYWVPGTKREPVKLLEYADHVKIFLEHGHECLAEYPLPAEGVKNQRYTPPGKNSASVSAEAVSQGSALGRATAAIARLERERISRLRAASSRHVAAASVHARTVRSFSKNNARCFSAGDSKSSSLSHPRSLDHPPHRLVLHQPAGTDLASRRRDRRRVSTTACLPRRLSHRRTQSLDLRRTFRRNRRRRRAAHGNDQ